MLRTSSPRIANTVLVALSVGAGLLLSWAGLGLVRALDHRAAGIPEGHREELRDRLDRDPGRAFLYDEGLNYRFKPGYRGLRPSPVSYWHSDPRRLPHATNSLGLLGVREVDPGAPEGNVVFLGDSVTFGEGVAFEETFVARMDSLAPPDFPRLLNAGCPGWNSRQELLFARERLGGIPWSLTVLVFCPNDLSSTGWTFTPPDTFWLDYRRMSLPESLRMWALRRRFTASPSTSPLAAHDSTFLLGWDARRWKRYQEEVLVPGLVEARPGPVAVVAIPTCYQVEALLSGATPEEALLPQLRLAHFCREWDIPFFDTTAALAGVGEPGELFRDFCHLTPEGHQRVARYLLPRIGDLLSRPPSLPPGGPSSP